MLSKLKEWLLYKTITVPSGCWEVVEDSKEPMLRAGEIMLVLRWSLPESSGKYFIANCKIIRADDEAFRQAFRIDCALFNGSNPNMMPRREPRYFPGGEKVAITKTERVKRKWFFLR